jgi:uncharacterized YigZ family protein
MQERYQTIQTKSEGTFKDKGSKFLAFAFPVKNEYEINMHRSELRKKYFDARHHAYAFQIGTDQAIYRASDDGEPSNSSGPPILGQIRSYCLTNILIVVVRYFGGTKLGIPGLINAYKSAAKDAIEHADIILKNVELPLIIEFKYESMNEVMRILKSEGVKITSQDFGSACRIELSINKINYEQIFESLNKLLNIKIINP